MGFGFLDQSLEESNKTENEEKLDLNAAYEEEEKAENKDQEDEEVADCIKSELDVSHEKDEMDNEVEALLDISMTTNVIVKETEG